MNYNDWMKASDLSSSEYNPYYSVYINLNEDEDLLTGLRNSSSQTQKFFETIPKNKLEYRYDRGKWSIKEILQHIIDTERVFSYRAMRIARKDNTPLTGFDQDTYVERSDADSRDIKELLLEYRTLRESTIQMFYGFTENMLRNVGEASNSPLSPRAAGFIISGHEKHHCRVIKERYL